MAHLSAVENLEPATNASPSFAHPVSELDPSAWGVDEDGGQGGGGKEGGMAAHTLGNEHRPI